ncbi:MAG: DUF1080 domain-containing protein [Saprospiraceae bacterium]
MRILFLTFLLFAFAKTTFAQALTDEEMDPRVTEQYLDVKVVTASAKTGGAPSDAIVLFDGSSLSNWQQPNGSPAHWTLGDGAMTVASGGDVMTKDSFENFQLHIEWRTPAVVKDDGQNRGNSGLFLQNRYEVQILDNYNNATYSNGQAGSIYKQTPPLVNACKGPGEWQTYDVIYSAPVFSAKGALLHPAYVTVMHNGVIVQNHTAIQGTTPYKGRGVYEAHGAGPIRLQDHGSPMSYRNIWLRPM